MGMSRRLKLIFNVKRRSLHVFEPRGCTKKPLAVYEPKGYETATSSPKAQLTIDDLEAIKCIKSGTGSQEISMWDDIKDYQKARDARLEKEEEDRLHMKLKALQMQRRC